MKCPHCKLVMGTVDVEYISRPQAYILDGKTGKYIGVFLDVDIDDDSFSLYCGECGHELEGGDLELFQLLIDEPQEVKGWGS